jgi:hypothetical protein
MERSTIFDGKTMDNSLFLWPFSIAMLNYQRVPGKSLNFHQECRDFGYVIAKEMQNSEKKKLKRIKDG